MVHKLNFNLDTPEDKAAPRARQGHSKCEVYGCPWDGQIYTGGWNCRYHHGKGGSSLTRITLALKNHTRDFRWYEFILNRTLVDFVIGDIEKKAPDHLRVLPNETFKDYRERMKKHIDGLLEVKSRLLEVAP